MLSLFKWLGWTSFSSFQPHWLNLAYIAQWLYKSPINNLRLRPDFPQASFSKQCGTATWTAKCDSLPASGPWLSARWDCWWGGSRQSSALAGSSAWRWTPMDHNSGAGQETRNCRVGGFSLSLWGRLAAGGPNLPVKKYLCTWLFHGCLCWNESRLWLDLIIFLPPHNPPTRRGLPRLDWIPYLSSYYLTLPVTDKWSISATDGTRWPK